MGIFDKKEGETPEAKSDVKADIKVDVKEETKSDAPSMDSKAIIKDAAKKNLKIRRTERIHLEVIKDTKHYKKGQLIEPHVVFGNALIKGGVAKEYTPKKEDSSEN